MCDRENWENTQEGSCVGSLGCRPEDCHGNPIIYVAGDFNHRDVGPTLRVVADLQLVHTAPTRGGNTLNLVHTAPTRGRNHWTWSTQT